MWCPQRHGQDYSVYSVSYQCHKGLRLSPTSECTILVLSVFFQNVAFPSCFPYTLCCSDYFSSVSADWVDIAAFGSISVDINFSTYFVNWFIELPSPMISQLNGCPLFCVSFLFLFFLKLTVTCRLCVIYVMENNDSNVHSVISLICDDMYHQNTYTAVNGPMFAKNRHILSV